jgi:hypothetical protein
MGCGSNLLVRPRRTSSLNEPESFGLARVALSTIDFLGFTSRYFLISAFKTVSVRSLIRDFRVKV